MDVVGTVSVMAAAYGYYKAGVYVADTVDKSIRIYTFCKNAVGYIRRPIRYYLDSDGESVDSYPDVPPRPFSCSNLDEHKYFNSDEFCNDEMDSERGVDSNDNDTCSDPGINLMSKTISDVSEFKRKPKRGNFNRETSISMSSEATEMYPDEVLRDVSWVLVKNPDYE